MLVAVSTVENVQKRQYSLCCVDFLKPGFRTFQMCVYFQRLMPSLPSAGAMNSVIVMFGQKTTMRNFVKRF